MSILYSTSFFRGSQDIPDVIKKLDELLIIKTPQGIFVKDMEIADYINNLIVKFGFMLIAKNYLEKSIHGDQPETTFFLSNFIYDSKAFLDAVTILLNHFYQVGLTGGDIDFRKGKFLEELGKHASQIASQIKKQQEWIGEVVKWRDALIHRSSVAAINYSPADETGKQPKDNIVKMPLKPTSIFELIKTSGFKDKMVVEQDIPSFCANWIKQAEMMSNITLFFIEKDLRIRLANS